MSDNNFGVNLDSDLKSAIKKLSQIQEKNMYEVIDEAIEWYRNQDLTELDTYNRVKLLDDDSSGYYTNIKQENKQYLIERAEEERRSMVGQIQFIFENYLSYSVNQDDKEYILSKV